MEQKPLQNLFDEIVDAIHYCDGETDGIAAKDFPERIRGLKNTSSKQNVFGVCWDYSKTGTAFSRLTPETDPNHLVTVSVSAEPNPLSYYSPFDAYLPWSGMVERNVVNGKLSYYKGETGFSRTLNDTFVHIPVFYYSCIDDAANSKRYWYVSDVLVPGLIRHPGSDVWVGRYMSSTGYDSKSNYPPLKNARISVARTALAKKSGVYRVFMYSALSAIQLLYLVEFADFDSQKKIGNGIVSSASPNYSGQTDSLLYHTGIGLDNSIQYRWLENIYGNLYEIIDGVKIENRKFSVSINHLEPDALVDTQTYGTSGDNKARKLAYSSIAPWMFIPSEYGTAGIPDRMAVTSTSGERIVLSSASYGNGADAGLFVLYGLFSEGTTNGYTGARIAFVET